MELDFPINLIGYGDENTSSGEVWTKHGEFLGTWKFVEDEKEETAVFHFIADGEAEPMFSEGVAISYSRMHLGVALRELTQAIRNWHEGDLSAG